MLDHAISAFDDLREHIGEPNQRVLDKQLDHLDRHCRDFIARSPIALLATADAGPSCAAASGTRRRGRRPTSCHRRPRSTATTATRPG
jgi:predicted pyridoxine 5'-phosphate oxidase superfamily flavin-nucleotide-binding protein